MPSSRLIAIGLGLVLAVGVMLRVVGLLYGLPAVYNPDEVAIMNRALAFSSGDLNPNNFVYPTLYFYVLFAWEGLAFAAGRVAGVFDSVAAFERSYFVDPTFIFAAGRTLTVVCGALTIWLTYLLGSRVWTRATGLAAAAFLATAPLAVRDAHYVKHDIPVTLLIVAAHLLLARLILDGRTRAAAGRPRAWAMAGAVAGLAISTHYYAVFTLVPMVLAVLLHARDTVHALARVTRIVAVGGGAAIAFVLTSPFLVWHPARALMDIAANRRIVIDRATESAGLFASLGVYLEWIARDGTGPVVALLAIVGAGLAVRAGRARAILLLAFPITFLLFIANTFPASRYLNPVLPFAALLAAGALAPLFKTTSRLAAPLTVAVVVLAIGAGIASSARADSFFRRTDTRTLAREWIEVHVPPGRTVLIQPYSVPLLQSQDGLREALTFHLGSPERASRRFARQLEVEPYPAPTYRLIYLGAGGLDTDKIYLDPASLAGDAGREQLRAARIDVIVLKRSNSPDPALAGLDRLLPAIATRAATFAPYRADASDADRSGTEPFLHNTDTRILPALDRPGPIVEVWQVF